MNESYIVVCRADRIGADPAKGLIGRPGGYVLATRQVFATWPEAEKYRKTINYKRTPMVVNGRFSQLRLPPGSDI